MATHRKTVRMNPKLTVEEDLQRQKILPTWKVVNPKVLTKEGTIRGRTSKDVD
jgi:hypothetical protein